MCVYSPQTVKLRESAAAKRSPLSNNINASPGSDDAATPLMASCTATPMSVSSTPGTEGSGNHASTSTSIPPNVEIQFQNIQVHIDNLERLLDQVRRRNLEGSSDSSSPYSRDGRTPNSDTPHLSGTSSTTELAGQQDERERIADRLSTQINKLKTSLDTHTRDQSHAQLKVPTFEWNALVDQVNFLKDAFRKGQDKRLFPRPHSSDSVGIFSGFPFFQQSPLLPEQIIAQLPPRSLSDFLFESYFNTSYLIFRVVYEPRVRALYKELWENVERHKFSGSKPTSMSLTTVALMCSLFCTAALYLGDDNAQFERLLGAAGWTNESDHSVGDFINRMRVLSLQSLVADNFLIDYSVVTVQTLLIILDGLLHSNGEDGPTWPMFGMVCNMAISLGCNADRRELKGLSLIEREERKRSWAGLLLLENMQLCLFGRPTMMFRPDTTMPLNVNDEDLASSTSLEALERTSDPTRLTQMTFMLLKVKVGGMFSSIHTRMRKKQLLDYHEVREVDLAVADSVREWDIPYKIQKGYAQNSSVKYDMLRNFLDQNLLVLHRPYYFTHPESRQRCIESAHNIVHRIYRFSTTPEYQPFRCYVRGIGAFYCFHAAVVLAIAAAQEWMETRDTKSKVFQDFEKAADSLDRMNELSPNLMLIVKSASVTRTVRETLVRVMSDPYSVQNLSVSSTPDSSSARLASLSVSNETSPQPPFEGNSDPTAHPSRIVHTRTSMELANQVPLEFGPTAPNPRAQPQTQPQMGASSSGGLQRQPSVDTLDQIFGPSAMDAYQWLSPNDVHWHEWESVCKKLPDT